MKNFILMWVFLWLCGTALSAQAFDNASRTEHFKGVIHRSQNDGNGETDGIFYGSADMHFDGIGNCTIASGSDGLLATAGDYVVTTTSSSDPLASCTYQVLAYGGVNVNLPGNVLLQFVLSRDGNYLLNTEVNFDALGGPWNLVAPKMPVPLSETAPNRDCPRFSAGLSLCTAQGGANAASCEATC